MTEQQTELFDVRETMPRPCPVPGCQSILLPGQKQVITCAHDLNPQPHRRPRNCLNRVQPGDLPDGY